MCNIHHQKLNEHLVFLEFGKRNGDGDAVVTLGNKTEMGSFPKKMEDLEIQAVHMEESLQSMMEKYYKARTIIRTKDDIIKNKDAIIAGLRAQLNHSDEDDNDDCDND